MADEPKKPQENPLVVTKSEQYRTAGELIERSHPNATYYIFLAISSLIVAAGLLLNNATIVIGGMLVAPVLTPLLAISLGLSIGELQIMKETSWLLIKSFIIVALISFFMAIILGIGPATAFNLEGDFRASILYFFVALASGAAATFAWSRKENSEILPGIAIAVSLVPPMSLVGIWLSQLNVTTSRFYFSVFLLNLFGIIIGSLVVFSLLRFYRARDQIHKKVAATAAVAAAERAAAAVERAADKAASK
jgi:uncharacterized hydrophobic protein (TIGR00271 family)